MKKFTLVLTLMAIVGAYSSVNLFSATPYYSNYVLYKNLMEVSDYYKDGNIKDNISKRIEALQSDISSESANFEGGDREVKDLMKRLSVRIVEMQDIDGVKIYYGFSARLRGGIIIGREKINIQIAQKDNKITVGIPIIVGSY